MSAPENPQVRPHLWTKRRDTVRKSWATAAAPRIEPVNTGKINRQEPLWRRTVAVVVRAIARGLKTPGHVGRVGVRAADETSWCDARHPTSGSPSPGHTGTPRSRAWLLRGRSVAWWVGPVCPASSTESTRATDRATDLDCHARNRALHEAHLPTQAAAPGPQARVPSPYAYPWRALRRRQPSREGPRPSVGLSRRVCPNNPPEHSKRSADAATSHPWTRAAPEAGPVRSASSTPRSRTRRGSCPRSRTASAAPWAPRWSGTSSVDGCAS